MNGEGDWLEQAPLRKFTLKLHCKCRGRKSEMLLPE